MEEIKSIFKKFTAGKDKVFLMVVIGVVGIMLIGFSGLKSKNSQKGKEVDTGSAFSDEEYCLEIEKKISGIVTAITGDTEPVVAVTLETGSEYVYADQNKTDSDQTEDKEAEKATTKESRKTEQEYIIIKSDSGDEKALVITEKKPGIRGIAVVTEGLDDDKISKIEDSISSVAGITSRKICITKKVS